ncbi:Serine/threonine-protein kinase rio2 [Nosema granulosis]|uniref:non-specific serine/threonine protein kinase n=1 Tax=Nosema granulosis TaxID=83296 RepID=A0A9P6GZA0_9MICR|nr:Serine/threonine-protein kinase rio2 [Nosema granulosis]
MILISDGVWSISKTHLKILECIEDFMAHNKQPTVDQINAKTKIQCINNYIRDLCKLKFIRMEEGTARLTISGFDCIAINALRKKGLEKMGSKINIGKESDIYYGVYAGREVILKFHRLGRTSFKSVKNNRDYTKGKTDWFRLNKISCKREVEYYKLFQHMDIPKYYDYSRHVIVLELLDYKTLYTVKVDNPEIIFNKMIDFIKEMWIEGYVHGDFNEFNVMVKDQDIKVIDFPQCVKKTHKMALEYLKRDFQCVETFFEKKHGIVPQSNVFEEFISNQ